MNGPNIKILRIGISLFFILLMGGIVFSQHWIDHHFEQNTLTPELVQKINETHERLSQLEAFQPLQGQRDAGVILNRHIALDGLGPEPEEIVWWTYPESDDRTFIKANWLENTSALYDDAGQLKWDPSILSQLLIYDHWDTTTSGPFAQILSEPISTGILTIPIPNLVGLQFLARVRLGQGLHEKDILPALKEVRHLARLTQGHSNLVDSMIAMALLKLELLAFEQAKADGLITETDWTPVSEADIETARSLIWASIDLYDLSTHHTAQSFMAQERVLERCAILNEAGVRIIVMKSIASKPRWPFEYDIFSTFDHFEADWKASGCRLEQIEQYWTVEFPFENVSTHEFLMTKLPYLRMYTFWVLGSIGSGGNYDLEDFEAQ